MMRKRFLLLLSVLLILPLLRPVIAAGEDSGKDKPAAGKPAVSSLLRKALAKGKRENPNICPICGKSWDIGSHAECLKKILPPEKAVTCPSCSLKFYVEDPRKVRDPDRDLCPHSPGAAGASGELYICPRCGFSYFRQFFKAAGGKSDFILPVEQRDWIAKTLTPRIHQAIRKALGNIKEEYQPADRDLYKLFNDSDYSSPLPKGKGFAEEHIVERQIPDFLRCENALLYAKRFYRQKPLVCARMAQLAAWAYRRKVCEPLPNMRLVKNLQRLQKKLMRGLPEKTTLKQKIDKMWEMFKDQAHYNIIDRELLLIMIAGKYQRLGAREWAKECVARCLKDADDNRLWSSPAGGSASPPGVGTSLSPQDLPAMRNGIVQLASPLSAAIDKEAKFLQEAAGFLRAALAQDVVPPQKLPAHIYLVGELERRCGNFARAYAWLAVAAGMDTGDLAPGAEIWAGEQLGLVKDALAHLGYEAIPPNPEAAADRPLLLNLEEKFKEYLQSRPKAE